MNRYFILVGPQWHILAGSQAVINTKKNMFLLSFRFINQILFVLPNVHGEFKTRCLEIILSRVKIIPNLFLELKTKGFMNVLNHR